MWNFFLRVWLSFSVSAVTKYLTRRNLREESYNVIHSLRRYVPRRSDSSSVAAGVFINDAHVSADQETEKEH